MPEVSVIIPAYNQGSYLKAAVDSVLAQTFPDFEVIVVDDGSTDHTPDVVKAFTDRRVCAIRQENRGLSGARNTGIRAARGAYLSFLDSDDLFLPNKLETLLDGFRRSPDCGMLAGQAVLIDQDGRPLGKTFENPMPADSAELLLGNPFHVGSVLLQKRWQEQVGFFDESLRSYEDWDLWLRLARAGCKIASVASPVSLYRFHTGQMTRIGSQMTRASFAVLEKVFQDPALPESWRSLHDPAYANAYLRAGAHSYLARDWESGKEHLAKAAALHPPLAAEPALLAGRLSAMADLPKSSDPLEFLEAVYDHLPGSLVALRQRKNLELGRAAAALAFQAYAAKDGPLARRRMLRAIRYRPSLLLNRGVLSVLLRTLGQTGPKTSA